MKYNLCTITFRHELVSFRDLITFANYAGFDGIELWGVHAKALQDSFQFSLEDILKEMEQKNLYISMLSDYLELNGDNSCFEKNKMKHGSLIQLAHQFGTNKIRIFAGNKGSRNLSSAERELYVNRLRILAEMSALKGCYLIIETHPHTLADTLQSTLSLIREIGSDNIRINLDFLHLWEAGESPLESYSCLLPWISNLHFKNVLTRRHLDVFIGDNIYSPNGSREGIVALADGVMNYQDIIECVLHHDPKCSTSIEWFGRNPYQTLEKELVWLRKIEQEVLCHYAAPLLMSK